MSITSIYSHICHDYFIHRKVRLTIAIKHSKIRLKSSRLSHHNTHELNSWTFHRIICIAHIRKKLFYDKVPTRFSFLLLYGSRSLIPCVKEKADVEGDEELQASIGRQYKALGPMK